MLRMRHRLGNGEGLARSVVSDIARCSFVTSIKTIMTGVIDRLPVMTKPIARNSTISIFLVSMLKV